MEVQILTKNSGSGKNFAPKKIEMVNKGKTKGSLQLITGNALQPNIKEVVSYHPPPSREKNNKAF